MEQITASHPLSKSADIIKENINALKSLFPTIVKEGKIDVEELKALLGEEIENSEEYYRFTWAGKSQARQEANKPSTGTLRPVKEESKNWETTQNIFIEGDNLEVLKLLQKSYADKIKVIYIDPPYNTGKDFVYKDNYSDNLSNYLALTGQTDEEGKRLSTNTESDGRYHSNWLNMMYPRLKLARNLLTDNGVIFISIDDNEVHNLRKICDEIFGEENFSGCFVVNSTPNARNYGHIAKMHEYCLMYCKNIQDATTFELIEEEKEFKYKDSKGEFNIHPLYNSDESFHKKNRPNLYYPFFINPNNHDDDGFYEISTIKSEKFSIEVYPPLSTKNKVQFVWRWSKDKSNENLNTEIIGYKTNEGEYRIVRKMRHTSKIARSMLLESNYSGRRGTAEVEELLKNKIFSFPKPLDLLKTILNISMESEDVVLDFFAGSGTTAHAVMELNAKDGGNRKFICVQLPEATDPESEANKADYKTIAEITKERLRRAGEKVKAEVKNDLFVGEKLFDIGFRVFKLDSSNINAWDGDVKAFEQNLLAAAENIKPDRTEEDVLYEILLKSGLDLAQPLEEKTIAGKKVFNIGLGALFICLANDLTTAVAEGIGKWKHELEPATCRVIFKDIGFNDVEKTNSIQILRRYGINEVNTI